jgi:hypothetical protein
MQIAEFRPHADLEATKPQALQGGLNPPRRAEKSKDRAVHRLPPRRRSQPVRRPKLE